MLGGGVGGLSAAHELVERGFDVTVYEARDLRRQGAQAAGAGLGHRRARGSAGRARLSLLPGLLPAPARHDAADPVTAGAAAWPATSSPPTRVLLAQAGGRNELIGAAHAARLARRPRACSPLRARLGDAARHPAARARAVHGAAADAADQLRRAPLRAVGAARAGGSSPAPSGAARPTRSSSPTGSRARSSPRGRAR